MSTDLVRLSNNKSRRWQLRTKLLYRFSFLFLTSLELRRRVNIYSEGFDLCVHVMLRTESNGCWECKIQVMFCGSRLECCITLRDATHQAVGSLVITVVVLFYERYYWRRPRLSSKFIIVTLVEISITIPFWIINLITHYY